MMLSEPVTQLAFLVVAISLWGAMALRYPAPVAFLMGYTGLALFALDTLPLRILFQSTDSPLWALGTIATAALLARLLMPRLIALRENAPALAPYAPAVTGSAAAFAFDEASGSGQPASLANSMSNSLAGLSPLGLPLIVAALLMQVSVGGIMVAAILQALALAVVGAFLAGWPDGSTGARFSGVGADLLAPAVALVVLLLILSGVATPGEAFAVSTLLLLAILLRLHGLRETVALLNDALPDVARVVLLILAAAPVYALFYYLVRPDWLTFLWLDFPLVFFGLSLLVAAAFGMVGGSLAGIVAMVLLFGAPASANSFVQPDQILIAWVLAAEAGRFATARWQSGLEGAGAVWVFVLLASATLALMTDVWMVSNALMMGIHP